MSRSEALKKPRTPLSELRKIAEREELAHLTKSYGQFASEAAAIPESVRAQMTLLIKARDLRLVELIATQKQTSKQEYIRAAVHAQLVRDLAGSKTS